MLNIPMVSAIMQSVSNDVMAVALAKEGGMSFIYGSQSIEDEAAMVRRVKTHKAGFVVSASNLTPDNTLADVLALKASNGFSTVAITGSGATSKLWRSPALGAVILVVSSSSLTASHAAVPEGVTVHWFRLPSACACKASTRTSPRKVLLIVPLVSAM